MTSLEGFSPKSITESNNEIELVNQTEISKFEQSNLVSNEDIADCINETIPPSHLENCSVIRYESVPNELYPQAKGTFERDTHQICIWGEQFAGPQEVVATITHEIGHNVHENIMINNPELAERWSGLHEQSLVTYAQDGFGFVTDYARSSEYEDFADSYLTYIGDPEKLQFYNSDKYEFMKEFVFAGEEYPSRLLGGYYVKDDDRYDWNLFNEQGQPKVLFCCDACSSCSYDPNGCTP